MCAGYQTCVKYGIFVRHVAELTVLVLLQLITVRYVQLRLVSVLRRSGSTVLYAVIYGLSVLAVFRKYASTWESVEIVRKGNALAISSLKVKAVPKANAQNPAARVKAKVKGNFLNPEAKVKENSLSQGARAKAQVKENYRSQKVKAGARVKESY